MTVTHPPPAGADDAVLVRASWGEPDRFAEIFRRYFREIHRYAARRLGTQAADDVAAEAFLVAFRKREGFDPERGAVRPWLYGIATNLIGSHRRAEERYYRALARAGTGEAVVGHEERVVGEVTAAAVRGDIAGALASLSSGDRDVLLLVALAGFSYDEVAQALGIKPGTVASRLNRARRKLRGALGGADPTRLAEEPSR